MANARRPPSPLDQRGLDRLALRYVERFATTRAKLARYLSVKLRQRGWAGDGEPDPGAVAQRLASLGYIDDRSFAVARAGAMTRRGLGASRVRGALRRDGVAEDDAAVVEPDLAGGAVAAALAFARRRRIGPFCVAEPDRAGRERQLAAMVRGGHDFALARAIIALGPDQDVNQALAAFGPVPDHARPGWGS